MVQLIIEIDEETDRRLEAMAKSTGRGKSSVVQAAIDGFLHVEVESHPSADAKWPQRLPPLADQDVDALVREGIAAADAGDLIDHEELVAAIEARRTSRASD